MSDFTPASWEPIGGSRRPRWLFLLIGLALGLALGLAYTWQLSPVQFYDTDPVDLHPYYKQRWTLLVAAAYRQDGDLDRTMARLAGLDDPQISQTVAELTAHYIETGKSATRIRALAALSDALGARTDDMLIYLETPEPTLFFTPTATGPTHPPRRAHPSPPTHPPRRAHPVPPAPPDPRLPPPRRAAPPPPAVPRPPAPRPTIWKSANAYANPIKESPALRYLCKQKKVLAYPATKSGSPGPAAPTVLSPASSQRSAWVTPTLT